jgi:hypothetical protein
LEEKWEIDLDELRNEVQKRQQNMDWKKIMNLEFLNGK